jgi:hypothetical protein
MNAWKISAWHHIGEIAMTSNDSGKLIAWIEPHGPYKFTAVFVSSAMASRRAPATNHFGSPDEAREWVEREAAALDVPVEWTDFPRKQSGARSGNRGG